MLHIDTDSKPEVKGSSLKAKKKDHSAAGILDLLQASKQVGGIDYSTNRYFPFVSSLRLHAHVSRARVTPVCGALMARSSYV